MGLFLDHCNASQLIDFKNEVKRMEGMEWDKIDEVKFESEYK